MSKKTLSANDSEGDKRDIVTEVPETDLESISEEAPEVASEDIEDPRDLILQLQKLIVNFNVVDSRREMCAIAQKLQLLIENKKHGDSSS